MMKIKIYLLILIAIPLFSCSIIKKQDYYYNQIIIRNNTQFSLQNVAISGSKTHRFFSCSNIAPQGTCLNSFKKTKYLKNPITISFIHQGRQKKISDLVIEVPTKMNYKIPLQGILEIKSDGTISTYFEQN